MRQQSSEKSARVFIVVKGAPQHKTKPTHRTANRRRKKTHEMIPQAGSVGVVLLRIKKRSKVKMKNKTLSAYLCRAGVTYYSRVCVRVCGKAHWGRGNDVPIRTEEENRKESQDSDRPKEPMNSVERETVGKMAV